LLAFASEPEPLLGLEGVSRACDEDALAYLLTSSFQPEDRGATFYRDVRRVQPGETVSASVMGDVRVSRYWTMQPGRCGRRQDDQAPAAVRRLGEVWDTEATARIKRGVTAKARHKEVLALAKGYRGRSKNCYRLAVRRVEKGLQYAYRDRRNRKRDFRGLWIQRINAAARQEGLTYGRMIHGLKTAGIEIDRKVLADLAVRDQAGFTSLAKRAQAALEG
jgi:large subunit ribosomal protein L20